MKLHLFTLAAALLISLPPPLQAQYPVTHIDVVVGRDTHRPGWQRIEVDLNRGVGGDFLYIIYRREIGASPLRDLMVVKGQHAAPPAGYVKIPIDLNKGAGGDWLFLCYSRAGSNPPIVALDVVAGSSSVRIPPGFTKVPVDLNAGCGAHTPYIYLCYRRDSAPPPISLAVELRGFNKAEQDRIHQAIPVVKDRLLNVGWIDLAAQRSAYTLLGGEKIQDRNLIRHHAMMAYNALKQEGLPKIVIRSNGSLGGFAGQGTVGTISIRYVPGGLGLTGAGHYEVRGYFDIELNPNNVRNDTTDELAGTIVHEMWHNLGHSHYDSYTDGNFTTVMGDIVLNGGTYIPRTSLRLHGRPWPRP